MIQLKFRTVQQRPEQISRAVFSGFVEEKP